MNTNKEQEAKRKAREAEEARAEAVTTAARIATYTALRTQRTGKAAAIKNKDGQTIGHDGSTSGASKMSLRLSADSVSGLMAAAARMDKADEARAAAHEASRAAAAIMRTAQTDEGRTAAKAILDEARAAAVKAENTYELAVSGYLDASANDADDLFQEAAEGYLTARAPEKTARAVLIAKAEVMQIGQKQTIAKAAAEAAEGSQSEEAAYWAACNSVHTATRAEKSQTQTRIRKTYSDDGRLLSAREYEYTTIPHLYLDAYTIDEDGEAVAVDVEDVTADIDRIIATAEAEHWIMAEAIQTATPSQARILRQIAKRPDNSYAAIGRRLHMTEAAVKKQVSLFRAKAEAVRLTAEAVAIAEDISGGLIDGQTAEAIAKAAAAKVAKAEAVKDARAAAAIEAAKARAAAAIAKAEAIIAKAKAARAAAVAYCQTDEAKAKAAAITAAAAAAKAAAVARAEAAEAARHTPEAAKARAEAVAAARAAASGGSLHPFEMFQPSAWGKHGDAKREEAEAWIAKREAEAAKAAEAARAEAAKARAARAEDIARWTAIEAARAATARARRQSEAAAAAFKAARAAAHAEAAKAAKAPKAWRPVVLWTA